MEIIQQIETERPEQPVARTPSYIGLLLGRAADWIVPPENPAGAVYGVIVIGALLAAESGLHESYLDTLASAAITTCMYWLAHSYSDALGERLRTRERLTARVLLQALGHEWALIRGASIPMLALVLAALTGASQEARSPSRCGPAS